MIVFAFYQAIQSSIMTKELNMCINFGFAGFQGIEANQESYRKIHSLMQEFLGYAQNYNNKDYGFSGKEIQCNIFSGDLFCTENIREISRSNGYTFNIVTSVYGTGSDKIDADAVIALDIKNHNLSYPNMLAEYVVNKSDAVFLLWDGKQNFQEGILWTVLQLCKQKGVPYYLVNTNRLEEISFSADSYFVPYSSERVEQYVSTLYNYQESTTEPKPILFSNLWLKLFNRFNQKYKLKAKNIPYMEDKLLSKDYFPKDHRSYANHAMLA